MRYFRRLLPVTACILVVPSFLSAQNGAQYSYYFAHIASGGIWRTTFTYVNSTQNLITCDTNFYSDTGGPLPLSFSGIRLSTLRYNLLVGGTIHAQTDADPNGSVQTGWARALCTGPVKASALFRSFRGSVAEAEGSVLASTAPATRFVTYSDQITGVAVANPLDTRSTLTFTARNLQGQSLGTKILTLQGSNHGSFNVGPFMNLSAFQGSLTIDATSPILSLALNFESSPVFSALPPGQDESVSDFTIPISAIDTVEIKADDGQYLGLVSFANRANLNSVFNPLGSYGTQLSQISIFNIYGNYGSSFSDLSAFNANAIHPPTVLENNNPVGKLTTNRSLQDAIDPWYLLGYIRGKNY